MSNKIDRSNPGDLAAGTGLTFRTALNADRDALYDHLVQLEEMLETAIGGLFTNGTMIGNTAVLTIDSPTTGRVYCPAGYMAVVGGTPVLTPAINQGYTDLVLNHVFLVLGTDGVVTLRCSTSATVAANELWIGDVDATGTPHTVDNSPVGKLTATLRT